MTHALSDNPGTIRKRRYRDRLRRHVGVASVEYDEDLLDMLVALGHLTDSASLDRTEISKALTAFLRIAAPAALANLNTKKLSMHPAHLPQTVASSERGEIAHGDLCPACGQQRPKKAA
jgi:hypothetical protein